MKNVKALTLGAAIASALMSTAAVADLTGNLGATSNYMWRGQTQTAGGSSISGGVDYSHSSGAYAGIWTADTSFGSPETDFYAGFAGEAGDISYDVSLISYQYLQVRGADWSEVLVSGGIADFSFGLGITDNYADTGSDALYVEAAYEMKVGKEAGLSVHVGSYDFDDETAAGIESYIDYSITLSKGDWSFALSDTDLDENNTVDADPVFVVSWGMEVEL